MEPGHFSELDCLEDRNHRDALKSVGKENQGVEAESSGINLMDGRRNNLMKGLYNNLREGLYSILKEGHYDSLEEGLCNSLKEDPCFSLNVNPCSLEDMGL